MQVDAVIFGGGAAGLWLLSDLVESGRRVVLLEAGDLGQGQTVASQGILHGGLKYTLQGVLTPSAKNIREMPQIWRECLAGQRTPNLEHTRVRSQFCYLWRTDSVTSKLGMIGAKIGLRVAPSAVGEDDQLSLLENCPGTVQKLQEQVIEPASFLAVMAGLHRDSILKIDAESGLQFQCDGAGEVRSITLTNPVTGAELILEPQSVIFTAGGGNAKLCEQVGLSTPKMQRRPLHMVMVRGPLPDLNGHCVDGAKTRVTITSDIDMNGTPVWQVGGEVAEQGVGMSEQELLLHTRAELESVIPGIDLTHAEWATYRVDRAEGQTRNGRRPEHVQLTHTGNVYTAWPTKLVLAPQLSRDLLRVLPETPKQSTPLDLPANWPRPTIALPPWETCQKWHVLPTSESLLQKAG